MPLSGLPAASVNRLAAGSSVRTKSTEPVPADHPIVPPICEKAATSKITVKLLPAGTVIGFVAMGNESRVLNWTDAGLGSTTPLARIAEPRAELRLAKAAEGVIPVL